MLVPGQSLVLVVAALLGTSASAQSVAAGKALMRMNKPLRPATLDFATGTVTRGPLAHDRGGSTISDFRNIDHHHYGFVGVDTGGGACKWFTAGQKGSGSNQSTNASDGVHFAAPATTLGGGVKLSSAVEGTTGTF